MQIKLYAGIEPEQIHEAVKHLDMNEKALDLLRHFNELTVHVVFDQKTGDVKACELDNSYPKISPDPTQILHEIMEFKESWGTLNAARTKSEILIKEIDTEMYQKTKKGVTWRRDQCVAWLALQDAMEELGKLRSKHGV